MDSDEVERLWNMIRSSDKDVVSKALLNRNFSEEMAITLARMRSTPPEILGFLASDVRFRNLYELKYHLAKNPKTPQRIALSLLKFLRLFDLADLTRNKSVNINLRQKIEQIILEKIPSMPLGNQLSLARRASSRVVVGIMEYGDPRALKTCLESSYLTEGDLLKIINKESTGPEVIRAISEHPRWSSRYMLMFALVRNYYTPMYRVVEFIKSLKRRDLLYLYNDPKTPISTKPFIYRELMEREDHDTSDQD